MELLKHFPQAKLLMTDMDRALHRPILNILHK